MNRITETELREIGRVSLDHPPQPGETVAQALAASARRLFYIVNLWGAVAIAYAIARALIG